jgi:hypothetical protein
MKNIHLIPTDKPSRLHLGNSGLVLCDLNFGKNTINGQNIYITSDEEIKKDWCIDIEDNTVFKVKEQAYSGLLRSATDSFVEDSCKKIILTTDQDLIKDGVQAIDDEFLEWFVKNPSCEMVQIDTIEVEDYVGGTGHTAYPTFHNEYKIIIPQKEQILEEAANKYVEDFELSFYDTVEEIPVKEIAKKDFIEGAKSDAARDYWFEIFKERGAMPMNRIYPMNKK